MIQTTMTPDQMQAVIAALTAENATLRAGPQRSIGFKVSEKGAISVTGMGQWPTTLYRGQWLKILNQAEQLKTFIASNEAVLKTLGTWEKASK